MYNYQKLRRILTYCPNFVVGRDMQTLSRFIGKVCPYTYKNKVQFLMGIACCVHNDNVIQDSSLIQIYSNISENIDLEMVPDEEVYFFKILKDKSFWYHVELNSIYKIKKVENYFEKLEAKLKLQS